MHEEFAGWYEVLSLAKDEAHLENRWNAVDAVVDGATKATLELLVRLAFRTKPQATADVAGLRTKFAGGAASLGDEELVVLAGAALAWAMHPDDDNSSLAAALVSTASCGGLRELSLPMDLVGMAETAYRLNAEANRQRPSLDVGKPLATALDKTEVALAVQRASEGNPAEAIQTLATSLNKVIAAVAKRQTAVETEFRKYTLLQDEELDILWWLHGGHSGDLANGFMDVPPTHRPLGIARELAMLTKMLPGPTAVPSLLTRAGVLDAPQMTVVAAVQCMPDSWLNTVLGSIDKENISALTTPILFAMTRRQELEGAEGWAPAWSKLTSLAEGVALDPGQFAKAAYREFVLARLG